MKSIRVVTGILMLIFTLALSACSSVEKSKPVTNEIISPQLAPTRNYIPTQKYDEKTRKPLVYQATQNPYEALTGRIKKPSVELFIEARRAMDKNDHAVAKRKLERLLEQDDSLSGPWVLLGDIALDSGSPEEALEHYQKAISVNEVNVNAYLRLAKVERILGNFLEAQNLYATVLTIWPDFPEAHLNLGVLYDVYLNHPINAQRHMEAYQFLTGHKNQEVESWIDEISKRTGMSRKLKKGKGNR